MPTYDYSCSSCGHTLQQFQKITAEPLRLCPSCNCETLKRGPGGGIGLSFKGSGFYINDYAKAPPCSTEKKGSCCPCDKSS